MTSPPNYLSPIAAGKTTHFCVCQMSINVKQPEDARPSGTCHRQRHSPWARCTRVNRGRSPRSRPTVNRFQSLSGFSVVSAGLEREQNSGRQQLMIIRVHPVILFQRAEFVLRKFPAKWRNGLVVDVDPRRQTRRSRRSNTRRRRHPTRRAVDDELRALTRRAVPGASPCLL